MLKQIQKKVPNKPGCYIYFNSKEEVIYVGKAKDLKKRMSSYFNRANNTKTQYLVSKIYKFDYYLTTNEQEALILENNLIKKYNPFYNIVLKDDKTYPYIYLSNDKYPILKSTRRRNQKGKYYGPYASGTLVNLIIKELNKRVLLRKCKTIPKEKCIYYHIKQCYAPCEFNVTADEVIKSKEKVDYYLRNNMKNLIKEINNDMLNYAQDMNFEKANEKKLILELINEKSQNQNVQFSKEYNMDYINFYKDDNFISLCILNIEKGKLINVHRTLFPYYEKTFEELSSYLYKYYKESSIEYFYTTNEEVKTILSNLLSMRQMKVDIKKLNNLEVLSLENAKEYYKKNINNITNEYFKVQKGGFKELQDITKNELHRIEVIDISHIAGDAQVGAIITYIDGKKSKSDYRKYKIKIKENLQNDYGSIKEVLRRRFDKGLKNNNLPNLLIIDGGKGQVSSALEVLNEFDKSDEILLIGLSKDNKHTTKGIVNKNLEEIILKRKSELYKFLYELQEEVHRFAIDFHRQVKVKSLFQSELDNIEGIGPKRKKLLIEHFEYVDKIKNASIEDFKELNLPNSIVMNIVNYFNLKEK